MAKYQHIDKEFGEVIVSTRSGMRCISARWKEGALHINAGTHLSANEILTGIDQLRHRIRKVRPEVGGFYSEGDVIECFKFSFTITRHKSDSNKLQLLTQRGSESNQLIIGVPKSWNLEDSMVTSAINSSIENILRFYAHTILPATGLSVANKLGLQPKGIVIGRGKRKLGHCTNEKVIQLSYNLMFFPEILIKYVVCHELAHLTHMNHSAAFHSLCNTYCLQITNHSEPELVKMMKTHKLPITK